MRPRTSVDLGTLCERAGVDAAFVRELEEYGLIEPRTSDGEKRYPERDVDVVGACARLARYGVAPRNLADVPHAAPTTRRHLLERIVAPELRSRNPERRHAGLEDLETLAALVAGALAACSSGARSARIVARS